MSGNDFNGDRAHLCAAPWLRIDKNDPGTDSGFARCAIPEASGLSNSAAPVPLARVEVGHEAFRRLAASARRLLARERRQQRLHAFARRLLELLMREDVEVVAT